MNVVKNSLCEGNRPTEIGAYVDVTAAAKLSVEASAVSSSSIQTISTVFKDQRPEDIISSVVCTTK